MVEADGERTFLTVPGIECHFQEEWFSSLAVDSYDSVYVSGYELEGDGGDAILNFLESNQELTVYYAPGPRITYIDPKKLKRLYALHPVMHLNELELYFYKYRRYHSGSRNSFEINWKHCVNHIGETRGTPF